MTPIRRLQTAAVAFGAVWPVLAGPAAAHASERRWRAAVETGPAWQTRNDFRIPGDAGTPVELAEYDSGPAVSVRATLTFDLTENQSLRLLAAPLRIAQGRAEDLSLKGVWRLSDRVELDVGYRLLEGGADNDEVYTFAFFHYAVAGGRVRF